MYIMLVVCACVRACVRACFSHCLFCLSFCVFSLCMCVFVYIHLSLSICFPLFPPSPMTRIYMHMEASFTEWYPGQRIVLERMEEDHPPSRYLFIIADEARVIGKGKHISSRT